MNINPIFYNVIIIILCKLLLLVILSWAIYFLFTYKKPLSRDESWYVYKINNFTLNKIYIGLYISVFIIFVTYLRIKRISFSLDLEFILYKILKLNVSLLNLMFLLSLYLLIGIIIILLMGKIYKFFIKEFKKFYLYHSYIMTNDGRATFSYFMRNDGRDTFSYNFINILYRFNNSKYNYIMIRSRITRYIIRVLLFINRSLDINSAINYILIILNIIPILMIPLLIVYDSYYNQFILTKICYYLLFYMFYKLWYNVSMYLWLDENAYSSILYEIYYSSHKMAYVDVPVKLEDIILDYIKKGMYIVNPARFDSYYESDETSPQEYAQEIERHRFFTEDGKRAIQIRENTL